MLVGRILCTIGVGSAVVGAFFVSVATDIVGIILGVIGYYLGARVFGVVVIVFSTITFFFGLAFGIDAIPGSYDEAVSGISKSFEK